MGTAKKKNGTSPASQQHPEVWQNMGFTLQYGWLNVLEMLSRPGSGPGKFVLEPFDEPDLVGEPLTRLRPKFKDGDLLPQWRNTVFDTCGTKAPRPAQELPEYADTPVIKKAWRVALDNVLTELAKKECELQRIEGLFHRVERFPNEIRRREFVVRGVYLAGAVRSSTGPNTDLVLFTAKDPAGGPAPDGGATGPPNKD